MRRITRRSVIHGSVGLMAAGTLARPYIANAAATTMTMWHAQGFVEDEDKALRQVVEDYEKASGNHVELTIIPFAPERQRIVSAMTSSVVPDLFDSNPGDITSQYAWTGQWTDVSDVIETQKANYSKTALLAAYCYNSVEKKRSYYGVPYRSAVLPCHIWKPLVEKAGYKMEDIPKTWDAYFEFFKKVQDGLRKQGERKVYGLGYQVTTNGVDPNNLFYYFLVAHGGGHIVTEDGKLHLDGKVKTAAIKTLTQFTSAYKEGYVPPSAINWNDADDNNAFHARQMVMDVDGTLSTEVAIKEKHPDWYFNEIVTMGIPNDNAGKPVPSLVGFTCGLIPKGAKNTVIAKEFLKHFIEPKTLNGFLKTGLGRWLPVMPAIAKNDPYWTDPKDPHIPSYVQQGLFGPTLPFYYVYTPAISEVDAEHVWSTGMMDIINDGMTPQAAVEKAFKRVEQIFAKYPIEQS